MDQYLFTQANEFPISTLVSRFVVEKVLDSNVGVSISYKPS